MRVIIPIKMGCWARRSNLFKGSSTVRNGFSTIRSVTRNGGLITFFLQAIATDTESSGDVPCCPNGNAAGAGRNAAGANMQGQISPTQVVIVRPKP